jgi:Tfp pilus assembly protein PilF
VPDFDLLMILLGEKMGIGLLDEEIGERAEARTEQYRDRIQKLDTVEHPEVTKALAATLERSGGWWVWEQKVRAESDPKRREVIYKQGIQHCPQSADIRNSYAIFLESMPSRFDEAERQYLKAIELEPKDCVFATNFAIFLTYVRGKHDEAERLFRSALELNAHEPFVTGAFANFMTHARGDHVEAERLYELAIDLNPKDPINSANFAAFFLSQGRIDEASALLEKATALLDAIGLGAD